MDACVCITWVEGRVVTAIVQRNVFKIHIRSTVSSEQCWITVYLGQELCLLCSIWFAGWRKDKFILHFLNVGTLPWLTICVDMKQVHLPSLNGLECGLPQMYGLCYLNYQHVLWVMHHRSCPQLLWYWIDRRDNKMDFGDRTHSHLFIMSSNTNQSSQLEILFLEQERKW